MLKKDKKNGNVPKIAFFCLTFNREKKRKRRREIEKIRGKKEEIRRRKEKGGRISC